MADVNDWNKKIVAEFRENDGVVGGRFAGIPLLLLHNRGAKSGEPRLNPVAYQQVGDAFAVFASFNGAPQNPAWYHNLVAHPDVEVEVGTERFPVTARVTTGAERTGIWEQQKADFPGFAEYEEKAGREIPVILLERA